MLTCRPVLSVSAKVYTLLLLSFLERIFKITESNTPPPPPRRQALYMCTFIKPLKTAKLLACTAGRVFLTFTHVPELVGTSELHLSALSKAFSINPLSKIHPNHPSSSLHWFQYEFIFSDCG